MSSFQHQPIPPHGPSARQVKHYEVRPNREFSPPPKVGYIGQREIDGFGSELISKPYNISNSTEIESFKPELSHSDERTETLKNGNTELASKNGNLNKLENILLYKLSQLESRVDTLENENLSLRRHIGNNEGNQEQKYFSETNNRKIQELELNVRRQAAALKAFVETFDQLKETLMHKNINEETRSEVKTELSLVSDDVKRLKSILSERINSEQEFEEIQKKKSATLFGEVVRLGQMCENLNTRQNQIGDEYSNKIADLTSQINLGQDASEINKLRDQERIRKLEESNSLLSLKFEKFHAEANRLSEGIRNEAEYCASIEAQHVKWAQEMRQELMRCDANFGEKLSTVIADVSSKLLWEQSNAQKERHRTTEQLTKEINRIRDEVQVSQRIMDSKLLKLQEDTESAIFRTESKSTELSLELDNHLKQLSTDLRREEADRTDTIRQLREDIYDRVASSATSNEKTSLEVGEKLQELEEVVRAEVRSRMRHEAKAREHLENTATSLRVASEGIDTSLKGKLAHFENKFHTMFQEERLDQGKLNKTLERKIDEAKREFNAANADLKIRLCQSETTLATRAVKYAEDMKLMDEKLTLQDLATKESVASLENKFSENLQAETNRRQIELDKINQGMTEVDLNLRQAISASNNSLTSEISKVQRDIQAEIQGLDTKFEDLHSRNDANIETLNNEIRDSALENEVSLLLSTMVADVVEEETKFDVDKKFTVLTQNENQLQKQIEDKAEESLRKLNDVKDQVVTNENSFVEFKRNISESTDILKSKQNSLEEATDELAKNMISSIEECLSTAKSLLKEETEILHKKADELETAFALEALITTVTDNDRNVQLLRSDSESKRLRRDVETKLDIMKQEIEDEKLVSQQIQTHISGIFTSIEDEKKRQEREWEKSVEKSKLSLTEVWKETSDEIDSKQESEQQEEILEEVTHMNVIDPFQTS